MFKMMSLFTLMSFSLIVTAETPQEYMNRNLEGVYFVNDTYAFTLRKVGENKFEWRFACSRYSSLDKNRLALVCGGVSQEVTVAVDGTTEIPVPMNGMQKVWLDPQQPNRLQSKKSWLAESQKSLEIKIEDVFLKVKD